MVSFIKKLISRFSVGSKVLFLSIFGTLSLILLSLISYNYLKQISVEVDAIAEEYLPTIEKFTSLEAHILEKAVFFEKALLHKALKDQPGTKKAQDQFFKYSKKSNAEIKELIKEMKGIYENHAHQKNSESLEEIIKKLQESEEAIKSKKDQATSLFTQLENQSIDTLKSEIEIIEDLNISTALTLEKQLNETIKPMFGPSGVSIGQILP